MICCHLKEKEAVLSEWPFAQVLQMVTPGAFLCGGPRSVVRWPRPWTVS